MVKWLHDYLAIDKCQPNNIIFVERDMIITCCYTIDVYRSSIFKTVLNVSIIMICFLNVINL